MRTRIRAVRPYLDKASDALGETIHLARLDGPDVVYLATRESHEHPRTISRVGRRVPTHAGALGKALPAERADDELPFTGESLAALTENTHTSRTALLADPARVRERGYSIDREETVTGIACFGFALRYDISPATDAISCSVLRPPLGLPTGRTVPAPPDRPDGPPRRPTGHRLSRQGRYRPAVGPVLDEFALAERASAPSTRREATICPGVVSAMARNSRLRCAWS